jgi:hypothetical protein
LNNSAYVTKLAGLPSDILILFSDKRTLHSHLHAQEEIPPPCILQVEEAAMIHRHFGEKNWTKQKAPSA